MNSIKEYSINEQKEWNKIVRAIDNYEVFYLAEYNYAFMMENPQNGIPVLLLYENQDEYAINVVFKRDISLDENFKEKIPENKFFDLITPYGYGGFIGKIKDYQSLNNCYTQYCKDNHFICEFVRFELFGDYWRNYCGEVESHLHNVIRNLNIPLDEIWMDFKQKVRKNVKKAIKNGLEVIIDADGKYIDEFLRIYYPTMKRSNAQNKFFFSKKFFEYLNQMTDNTIYFYIVYQGKVISAELVLYDEENAYSFLGGTDSDFFELRPNDLLKFEVIKWAKEKKLKNFVLGGGYGEDDGIFQYKACLSPYGIVDFYTGKRIYDMNSYEKLVSLRNNLIENEEFFPRYRG